MKTTALVYLKRVNKLIESVELEEVYCYVRYKYLKKLIY